MKSIKVLFHIAVTWGWILPGFLAISYYNMLIEEGVPDMLLGAARQFDFDFVTPVGKWMWITLTWAFCSSIASSYQMRRVVTHRTIKIECKPEA